MDVLHAVSIFWLVFGHECTESDGKLYGTAAYRTFVSVSSAVSCCGSVHGCEGENAVPEENRK